MKAPFPYYGGKGRWAPLVWERLGNPTVYAEPFAGSLAVLLARPSGPGVREIVCDTDGHICNFWRAVQADPDTVAKYCDWPTIHQDLTARHRYLVEWRERSAERLSEDPRWYDAEMAGWWVWGISIWIGGGWCERPGGKMPCIVARGGGGGVSKQRNTMPRISDKTGGHGVSKQRRAGERMPSLQATTGGRGVSKQQRPYVDGKGGGRGVARQRCEEKRPYVNDRGSGHGISKQAGGGWHGVFRELAERLENVVVLNRDWRSALTPTVLMHTETGPKPAVGILMDPPYRIDEGNRKARLYATESTDAARDSYDWAVEHGERFRVAYCCREGDFAVPDGWTSAEDSFKGIRDSDRRQSHRDQVMFSPACLSDAQGALAL